MPTLKDKTQKPKNVGAMINPTPVSASQLPAVVNLNPNGLAQSGSLGPAPSIWTTAYDSVRQWTRPGTSQVRFPPLPTKSNPQVNAQARSVATSVVQTPAAAGKVTLDVPDIFTPVDQTSSLPNCELDIALALQNDGTVFAVPPNPIPNVGGLVYRASSSAPNLASRTVSTTVSTLNIGVFVTNQAFRYDNSFWLDRSNWW